MAEAPRIAVALHELPLMQLGAAAPALEQAGVHEWYFRISDGAFAPGPQGGIEWLAELASSLRQPVYAHLQAQQPDRLIDRIAQTGCRGIIVPQESCTHAHRTLAKIMESGLECGISLCAATPLTTLEYPLDQAQRVLLHTTEPSHRRGERLVESAFERVRILAENLRYRESRATLQVIGALDAERAARMHKFGAHVLTVGREALPTGVAPQDALAAFLEDIANQRHLV